MTKRKKQKKQPRDKKGRFMKVNRGDERRNSSCIWISSCVWIMLLLVVGLVCVCGICDYLHAQDSYAKGYANGKMVGYQDGHTAGLSEKQQVIWDDGFAKGRGFDLNWTIVDSQFWWLNSGEHILCEKNDSGVCKMVDAQMNLKYFFPFR